MALTPPRTLLETLPQKWRDEATFHRRLSDDSLDSYHIAAIEYKRRCADELEAALASVEQETKDYGVYSPEVEHDLTENYTDKPAESPPPPSPLMIPMTAEDIANWRDCDERQDTPAPPPAARLDLEPIKARVQLAQRVYGVSFDGYPDTARDPVDIQRDRDRWAVVGELERLRSPGAGEARLRELAREAARHRHVQAVTTDHLIAPVKGHKWVGGGDTWQGFYTCPHPDCVLVRVGLVPGQEQT